MSNNSLIHYNFMTKPAAQCLDMSDEYYKSCGVTRGSKKGFDVNSIEDGDIIFIKTDFIFNGEFQKRFLSLIKKKFILVSGVSSYSVSEGHQTYKDILENKYLIRWFCTNPPVDMHEKMEWLPIGFEEKEREGGNQALLRTFYDKEFDWQSKKDRIYIPYHGSTYGTRKHNIEMVSALPNVDVERSRLEFKSYLEKISEYKFVLSLRGAGWDCHRHYEVLLTNSIPIMDGGPIMCEFMRGNMPVLDIEDAKNGIKTVDPVFDKTKLLSASYADNILKCQKNYFINKYKN